MNSSMLGFLRQPNLRWVGIERSETQQWWPEKLVACGLLRQPGNVLSLRLIEGFDGILYHARFGEPDHVLNQTLAIAAGGAVGALLRFWMSNGVYALLGRGFPYGTLAVNVLGSLLMGFLYIVMIERMAVGSEWRAFALIGLLGAFTTFSTFSIETLNLLEQADYAKALANMLLSVLACVAAAFLGVSLARQL